MKLSLGVALLAATAISALPQPADQQLYSHEIADLIVRSAEADFTPADAKDLFKRKGGGGSGGRSGGSSGGSTSSGSRPAGSSTSSSGGRSSGGTGVAPAYGGGKYYAGGASVPYTAGGRSPSGLAPVAFLGVGSLAFFPGVWLYGAYAYHYSHPYGYYNRSSGRNESKPVDCLCQQYQVCGCDDNTNSTFMDTLINNGSWADMDDAIFVADVNGTSSLVLNGTLANGTTADGAAGSLRGGMMGIGGYVVMAATIGAAVMMI